MKTKPTKYYFDPSIYIDPSISWKTFKLLNDRLVKDTGPVPVHGTRILWQLLREKKILCYFSNSLPNDMGITLKVPKGRFLIIKDAKK